MQQNNQTFTIIRKKGDTFGKSTKILLDGKQLSNIKKFDFVVSTENTKLVLEFDHADVVFETEE